MARRSTKSGVKRTQPARRKAPAPPVRRLPPPPSWMRSDTVWMLTVVALYLIVSGIISFGYWRVGGYGVETDALGGYLPETKKLLAGQFTTLDGFKGPGYHLAVALVGLLVRDLFLAAKIVAIVSAGAVLVLLFRLLRRHVGKAAAWVALAVVATNAQFVLYTIQIGTDMYFLALALATATLLLENRTPGRALAAGALAGLAYLTRYNGVFLIVSGLAIYFFADRPERRATSASASAQPGQSGGRRSFVFAARLLRTGTFALAAFLVILPWSLFTWSRGMGFFYNTNYLNVAYEMYGRDVVSWDQFWAYFNPAFRSFGEVVGSEPVRFVSMALRNSVEHLWMDWQRVLAAGDASWTMPAAILWGIIIAAGLVFALARYRWRAWPPVFIGIMTYGVLVPVFYGERFSLPMLPIYAALAALAVHGMANRKQWPLLVRFAPTLAVLILLSAGAVGAVNALENLLSSSPEEIRLVADAAKGRVRPGERVLARKPHIAYFLGLEFVRMPMLASLNELPGIARRNHARYLFVSSIEASLRRPLRPLLDPRRAPPYLRPIAATTGRPAVLYEFTIDIPPPSRTAAKARPRRLEAPQKVRLGRAYLAAGKPDLAYKTFTEALHENPDDPTARLALMQLDEAWAMSVLRDTTSSAKGRSAASRMVTNMEGRLRRLAEQYPNSRATQIALGDFLVRRKRDDEAIPFFRRAVELDSSDAQIVAALANLERGIGHLAEAEATYSRLLRLFPDDPNAHRLLGETLFALKRYGEAAYHFERALALDSTSVTTRADLARTYDAVGNSAKARPLWQYVVSRTTPGRALHDEARAALGEAQGSAQ